MSRGRLATTTWSLVGMLGSSLALADSECHKGFRDTTAAERETMTWVLEIAKRGLPAAPASSTS